MAPRCQNHSEKGDGADAHSSLFYIHGYLPCPVLLPSPDASHHFLSMLLPLLSQRCLGQFCSHPSWFPCAETVFISPSIKRTSLPSLLVTALEGKTHSWCRVELRIHPQNSLRGGNRRGSSVWNSHSAVVCVKICTGFVTAVASASKGMEDNRSFCLMLQAGHMDSSCSQPVDIGSCHQLETTSGFLTLAPSYWLSPIIRTVCC